ncbi:hypothetical protein PSNTI_36370 [Stutzerimonas stutzeri]|nr:hypothetical protein PSNTI_36370 [Stutzerimonas stutzeri]
MIDNPVLQLNIQQPDANFDRLHLVALDLQYVSVPGRLV